MPTTDPPDASAITPQLSKGEATRAHLLDAATRVFEEVGYLDTRISDITERAAVSIGTFYLYFDSKEQIFREVAEIHEAILAAAIERVAEEDPEQSGSDRIDLMVRRYLDTYDDNRKIMAVIEELAIHDDYVNDVRMKRQQRFVDHTELTIRRLQAEGLADPGLDPEVAAAALGGMLAALTEKWFDGQRDEHGAERIAEQVTQLWANTLLLTADPTSD